MKELQLVYNEKTGEWEQLQEPYITIEVKTKEDYDFLMAAVAAYKNRDTHPENCRAHGHWEYHSYGGGEIPGTDAPLSYKCTVCGEYAVDTYTYCPHCGAKMSGEEDMTMIEITLNDSHIEENIKAIMELRKMGFSDEYIQNLYNRQIEHDKKEDNT